MAGGYLTKQGVYLSNKYLNDVNDAVSGGAPVSVPVGMPSAQSSQTQPGDRIVLDDASALALSDTVTGTLYGGVYMYVGSYATQTAAPARGLACFYKIADVGGSASIYQVTTDAQPSAAVPTFFAGVYISAPTKGNFFWIQVAGLATCRFDSVTTVTAGTAGNWVTVRITPTTISSSFDNGAAAGVITLAAQVGVATATTTNQSGGILVAVMMTRGNFCGRI